MRWLWLVTAGATDLQFPLWLHEDGQWQRFRYPLPKPGSRKVHDDLITLLRHDRLQLLPEPDLKSPPRRVPEDKQLDSHLILSATTDGEFEAVYSGKQAYLIPDVDNVVGAPPYTQLPILLPKVAPLIEIVSEYSRGGDVTVVVLNTRRSPDTNTEEPIAAGPLVSRYISERLGIEWRDSGGQELARSGRCSTWLDLLRDDDRIDDEETQSTILSRLHELFDNWLLGPSDRIAVTPGGGPPQLKEIVERVAAARCGENRVQVVSAPERGGAASIVNLDYSSKWQEREALRFHCCEALRRGDFVAAYGLARRYRDRGWSQKVRDGLGTLLELPYDHPLIVNGRRLRPYELSACQVELSLCSGDVAGAVRKLGVFLEASVWELIVRSRRLAKLELQVDMNDERIFGSWPGSQFGRLLEKDYERSDCYKVRGLFYEWPNWLVKTASGRETAAPKAVKRMCQSYFRPGPPENLSLVRYRNLLSHGAGEDVKLLNLQEALVHRGLVKEVGGSFGRNFLAGSDVTVFLDELAGVGEVPLNVAVREHLDGLLEKVVRA